MPKKRIAAKPVTITLYGVEIVKNNYGGETRTRVPKGSRTGMIELCIDADALIAQLGPRAMTNHKRKSHLAGGAIEVREIPWSA